MVPHKRNDSPRIADPRVMYHRHATWLEYDLDETRRIPTAPIAEQGGACVDAELHRQFARRKRPRGMHVPATVNVRTDRAQPRAHLLGIGQAFPRERATVR